MRFNGIESEPLYHPPPRAEKLRVGELGDYIFYPSRMEPQKRQELLIEAMKHVRSSARVIFVGSSDTIEHYRSLIKQHKVSDRIEVRGYVTEDEIVDLYANALAVCYLPFDEDYGYVTLEGMLSARPIIVPADGGGATEFIDDSENGYVVEPDPRAIAQAIDDLYQDRARSKRLGSNAREKLIGMNISWKNVVERLIEAGTK
jgi:glycosyltransferase involved in cell wall biosynthesis